MFKSGDWLALCDVCQQQYYASELRERWDGYLVCKHDWEERHIGDFLRVKAETAFPSFIRDEDLPEISLTTPPTSFGILITDTLGNPVVGVQPSTGNLDPHIASLSVPSITDALGVSYVTVTPISVGTIRFNVYYGSIASNLLSFDIEGL